MRKCQMPHPLSNVFCIYLLCFSKLVLPVTLYFLIHHCGWVCKSTLFCYLHEYSLLLLSIFFFGLGVVWGSFISYFIWYDLYLVLSFGTRTIPIGIQATWLFTWRTWSLDLCWESLLDYSAVTVLWPCWWVFGLPLHMDDSIISHLIKIERCPEILRSLQ